MIYTLLGSGLLLFFALFVMRKISAWERFRIQSMKKREQELQNELNQEVQTKHKLSLELHELNNQLKLLEYQLDESFTP